MRYMGIDIGGTKCAVVIGNEDKILKKIRFDTTNKEETILNILSAVEQLGTADAVGISCGGPLDASSGAILSPPNLPGWDNVKIVQMIEEKFGVPCGLQNDANACALAEWRFGAGKGTKNMIFLTFGTGMGAGLILDGKLYAGTNGMAGEIGHIRMENSGPVGYGKAGSFEGFCSGSGIASLAKTIAKEHLERGETTAFCKSLEEIELINAKTVAKCARAGDKAAIKIYDICAEKLGMGLSILIDILNPEKIVIGSIYERANDLLYDRMMEVVRREALWLSQSTCEIVPAALGDEIGDYAALAVAQTAYLHKKGELLK